MPTLMPCKPSNHYRVINMATQKRNQLLPGSASHTRTQDDYMSIMLDAVSPDDWREII